VEGKTKEQIPEGELVNALHQREAFVLGYLYDHYAAALFGVIVRIVRDEHLSEDVLQETFVRIWANSASYDPAKGRLFTWMMNIARNLAIDRTRSSMYLQRKQNQDITEYVDDIDGRSTTQSTEDHIGLREVVARLSPEHRQLVEMMYFFGMTQAEIAEKTGTALGTVKTRLRAAISVLRKQLV